MKLFSGIFVLLTGALISVIAAYISVFGMIQLFAAHALTVGIMIGAIELGKLVSATWLKFNWSNQLVPKLHKSYLLIAIIATMMITSLGLFGFLSAAHLEQNAPLAGLEIQSQQYELRLAQKSAENQRLATRLDQIDKNIASFLDQGAASRGLSASQSMKKERNTLAAQIDANNAEINQLSDKIAPLKTQSSMVEAKLGPVKYLASLIGYGDNPEIAVQMVILLIMIPFDPLAIVLVLSGMITINQWRDDRKSVEENEEDDDLREFLKSLDRGIENNPEQIAPITPDLVSRIATLTDGMDGNPKEVIDLDTKLATEIPVIAEIDSIEEIAEQKYTETPDDLSIDRREELIDMLEQHPSLISELIAVVKDMENANNITISDITGAKVD